MNNKPIAIIAEGPNRYKVRFQTDKGEIESGVTIDDVCMGDNLTVPLLVGDSDFLAITEGDPGADRLRESIFALHAARHEYAQPKPNVTSEIRAAQSGPDQKRASA